MKISTRFSNTRNNTSLIAQLIFGKSLIKKLTFLLIMTLLCHNNLQAQCIGGDLSDTGDCDGDGILNLADLDDDNDGISDTVEIGCSFIRITTANLGLDSGSGLPQSGSNTVGVSAALGLPSGSVTISYTNVNVTPNGGLYVNDGVGNSEFIVNTTIPLMLSLDHGATLAAGTTDGFIVNDADSFTFTTTNLGGTGSINTSLGNTLSVTNPTADDKPNNSERFTWEQTNPFSNSYSFQAFNSNTAGNSSGTAVYRIYICVPKDTDADGTPDYLDLDSDNDGCSDEIEGPSAFQDASTIVCCDATASGYTDADGDNVSDFCDLDDDNDGILDTDELLCGDFDLDFSGISSSSPNVSDVAITTAPPYTFDATLNTLSTSTDIAAPVGLVNGSLRMGFTDNATTDEYQEYTINFSNPVIINLSQAEINGWFDKNEKWTITSTGSILEVNSPNITNDKIDDVQNLDGDSNLNTGPELKDITGDLTNSISFVPNVFNESSTTNGHILPINSQWSIVSQGFITSLTIRYEPSPLNTVLLNAVQRGPISVAVSCIAQDTDGDGTPDYLDLDSDNDGCFDSLEADGGFLVGDINANGTINSSVDASTGVPTNTGAGTSPQVDADNSARNVGVTAAQCDDDIDGVLNVNDICNGFDDTADADGDAVPDGCDLDDDNDGILDSVEITSNFLQLSSTDLGLSINVFNQSGTADISDQYGYAANSGNVVVTFNNVNVGSGGGLYSYDGLPNPTFIITSTIPSLLQLSHGSILQPDGIDGFIVADASSYTFTTTLIAGIAIMVVLLIDMFGNKLLLTTVLQIHFKLLQMLLLEILLVIGYLSVSHKIRIMTVHQII
jgi:hypothetical protein